MIKLSKLLLVGATVLLWAGVATALPVTFTFVSSTSFDAGFPSTQTFAPSLPFSGSGDIDEAGGTYNVTLPDFSVVIDVLALPGDDAKIDTVGWNQIGTFAGGVGGALTGTGVGGTLSCTDLGGGLGGLVCAGVAPLVAAWPPTGASGPTLGAPGATIDIVAKTITVVEPYDTNGGQIQTVYSYAFTAPEPGTAVLLGAGLLGLLVAGRRRA